MRREVRVPRTKARNTPFEESTRHKDCYRTWPPYTLAVTPDSGAAISNTYTLAQHVKTKPVAYRFYAGWIMSDKRFASKQYFENFLKKEAAKINADIQVK
ncbi:MAG: DUF4861 family protein [Ferruginibacter sp.]